MTWENDPNERGAADLVRRIREGDRRAEDELIERYRLRVGAILSGTRPDGSAADDLFQETFRITLERIRNGQLREPDKLHAFVGSVARKLVIEHFRMVALLHLTNTAEQALPDPEPDPLEGLLRSERAEMVRRVLSEMTCERDRAVLFRFYIAGDRKDAICRDLGLSSLHFNRVLFRARERYRELYLASAEHGRGG